VLGKKTKTLKNKQSYNNRLLEVVLNIAIQFWFGLRIHSLFTGLF